MNLEHTVSPHGSIYSLAETFENMGYPGVQAVLFAGLDRHFSASPTLRRFKDHFVTLTQAISDDMPYMVFEQNGWLGPLNRALFSGNFSAEFLGPLGVQSPLVFGYIGGGRGAEVTVDQMRGYLTQPPPAAVVPPVLAAPLAPAAPRPPMTTIVLKGQWKDALAGADTVTYRPPQTTETFTIRGRTYTLTKPRGLSASADILYDNLVGVLKKYVELNPAIVRAGIPLTDTMNQDNRDFIDFLKALDLYFGSSRFHGQICHTIATKISVAVAGTPDRGGLAVELTNRVIGINLSRMNGIGFPLNHGGIPNGRMFRPEYELPDSVFSEMAFFGRTFGFPDGLKPNYHVEQLPEIEFGARKTPGNGPKTIDVKRGLCQAYGVFSGLLNKEIKFLMALDLRRDPTAQAKWKSFFAQAQNGGCADEYFKNLQEWIITDGSQAAIAVVIDPAAISGVVHPLISQKSLSEKAALKVTLQTRQYLDASGDLNYDPAGPFTKAHGDPAFAKQQLQAILGPSYQILMDEFRRKNIPYDSYSVLSAVVGYDF